MSKFRDSRLYEALDYLDEAYVAEVVENLKVPPAPGIPTRKRGQLRYIVALAACLLVLSMAIPVITYVLQNYADIVGFFTNETTADTSPELTEPETPAPETTQNSPETSADTDHETTEAPYDGTTAAPEPEYDGSRGLLYKMWEDGKSYYLAGMGTCTDENIVVASTYDGYPVTVIGEDALAGYDRVKSITIPDSVTAIDMRAFKDCTGLESITIPDTVYYISGNAFMNCTSLKSIKLPASLELVNPSVFGGCTALEEIVVPDFVTEIYIMAFYQCTNLKSVTLGCRVEKIWADVFRDCENLTEINFAGTMARWNAIEKDDEWNFGSVIEVVHCTDGDVAIEPYSDSEPEYDGSQGLEYRVNDDGKGATLIGLGSCKDADIVVASFYKGYPVTDIEFAAFAGSTRITSITLSDSVLRVDYNTFSNCNENLKHIYISKSVQEFGENAFSFLKSLESITVSPENPRYYVEGNCLIDRETKCILRGWGEFTIPSDGSVTSIAKGAFSCCNIVNVTVPKGITEIGGAAFAFCASLKSISLPEGLTAIGSSMFDSCTSLESITLPDSVTMIDVAAFAYCENLLSIRIGRNVEVIEKQAFYYSAVREIEFAGTVSEWKGIRKPDSWNENCFVTVIHCSDDAIEIIEYDGSRGLLYKVMPDGKSAMLIGVGTNPDKSLIIATEYNGVPVTTIAAEAFRNNTNVKSIYILGSVQYIESEAFAFCTSLEKIVLPDSLISIGDGAFNGCTSLESINIPKGITEIGSHAFSGCSSLKEITIPEGVTNIGEEAFYLCKSLKSVTLPSTLEYIRDWAFAYCESLENISIPDRVKWIGQNAFRDCKKLEWLYIGKSVEQIQESAFKNCISLSSVGFPASLKLIAADAFSGCTKLSDIMYSGSVNEWSEVDSTGKDYYYQSFNWHEGVPAEKIRCSNGNVYLYALTENDAINAAKKFWNLPSDAVLFVKDKSQEYPYCYKIAHCEYAQSVGEFEIKREVYVDQRTGECKEVIYDYPNIPEVFLDVIFNREKFLYVEQTRSADGEYKYTTSEALFKDHSVHHENVFGAQDLWYHLIDIDGDSIPELIFPGSARSNYGMLFRVYNGKVYGYACILNDLNTDATYIWHEQAGNYVGRSQVYFDGIFYKSRSLTEYDKNDPNNIIYYVEGKETTKEKYEEFESAFSDEELEAFELDYYPIYVNPYPGG